MSSWKIKITFTEPLLGTVGSKDAWAEHVATDVTPEVLDEEMDTIPEIEAGVTGFHTNGNGPFLYDYVLKGFFKDACGMLGRAPDSRSSKLKAYKKVIDGLIFVTPRQIDLHTTGDLGMLERPLRAQTAKGERVAIAKSQSAPAGTWIECTVTSLGGVDEKQLREWLDYGALRGLGQWRNGGYGRFVYEILPA